MIYVVLPLLIVLALLQSTWIPPVPLLNVRPDLVLLVVLAWAIVRGPYEGAIAAFVGGLAVDALSSWPLGSHALVLLLVAVPLGWLAAPLARGNLVYPLVGTLAASALYGLLLLGLAQALGWPVQWGPALWRTVLPLAIVEATVMPLAYWLLHWGNERANRRRPVA